MQEWYLKVLKNCSDFSSRSRRKEYWMFSLFNVIVAFFIGFMIGLAQLPINIINIYYLATLIPAIAVGVRRMHDVGKSGWWLLMPIYNFVLLVQEGDKADNAYGPDPKGGSANVKPASENSASSRTSTSVIKINSVDAISQLEKLADLKSKGHLTNAEFDQKKKQILAG